MRQIGFGKRVVDRLSADLKHSFPDATRFSPRNLRYMRAFAAAWPDEEIVQRSAAHLPRHHHQYLLDKRNDVEARLWYVKRSLDEGWSRDILAHQIDTRLRERTGKGDPELRRSAATQELRASTTGDEGPAPVRLPRRDPSFVWKPGGGRRRRGRPPCRGPPNDRAIFVIGRISRRVRAVRSSWGWDGRARSWSHSQSDGFLFDPIGSRP